MYFKEQSPLEQSYFLDLLPPPPPPKKKKKKTYNLLAHSRYTTQSTSTWSRASCRGCFVFLIISASRFIQLHFCHVLFGLEVTRAMTVSQTFTWGMMGWVLPWSWGLVSMFHSVFSPLCLTLTLTLECDHGDACLCSTVSLVHRVYVSLCL